MTDFLTPTKKFRKIIDAITLAGGKLIFVGGCVRDILLGAAPKDWDAEIYGINQDKLYQVLSSIDDVVSVGKSFGVFKLSRYDIDISLPRIDQKIGPGHKGFSIKIDYSLSFKQAARRRDLTINSIGYDPEQKKILDPYGGQKDLDQGILRPTDPETFAEDPLRVLRVAQFSSRFKMSIHPLLVKIGQEISVKELSQERIFVEFEKLLLKGKKPSLGLTFLYECGVLKHLCPSLFMLPQQSWDNTLKGLDSAASHPPCHPNENLSLMLALLLCHLPPNDAKTTLKIFTKSRKISSSTITLLRALESLHTKDFLFKNRADYLWQAYDLNQHGFNWKDLLWLLKNYCPTIVSLKQLTEAVLESGAIHEKNIIPAVTGHHLIDEGLLPGKEFNLILRKCLKFQFETGALNPKVIFASIRA